MRPLPVKTGPLSGDTEQAGKRPRIGLRTSSGISGPHLQGQQPPDDAVSCTQHAGAQMCPRYVRHKATNNDRASTRGTSDTLMAPLAVAACSPPWHGRRRSRRG